MTFRKWILDLKIDIIDVLTISSVGDKYLKQEGCYDGIFALSGTPQRFIQKCVVGGRTMTADSAMYIVEQILNDFDATSLYPSAMERLDGFLKGKPVPFYNEKTYDELQKYDGNFVEIIVKKVGIERQFPLTSYKTIDGISNFTNDVVGKTLFVDKITLEDMVMFQNIEFEIVKGYYYNEGFNPKIKSVILSLFNKRVELKKQGNPAEVIYKFIINASYGKSILKPIEYEILIFDNEKRFNVYIDRNYNHMGLEK